MSMRSLLNYARHKGICSLWRMITYPRPLIWGVDDSQRTWSVSNALMFCPACSLTHTSCLPVTSMHERGRQYRAWRVPRTLLVWRVTRLCVPGVSGCWSRDVYFPCACSMGRAWTVQVNLHVTVTTGLAPPTICLFVVRSPPFQCCTMCWGSCQITQRCAQLSPGCAMGKCTAVVSQWYTGGLTGLACQIIAGRGARGMNLLTHRTSQLSLTL